jgi:uncharacterized protein YbjT (DUF2867 family)
LRPLKNNESISVAKTKGSKMILCVGSTGLLGRKIVNDLTSKQFKIRCLVRNSSNTSFLGKTGAEIIPTDFKDKELLNRAFKGVDTVISTFSTNIAKQPETKGLWLNDYKINLELIKKAKEHGVRKFVFTSYWGLAKFGAFEHGMIKKMIEDLLIISGLDYTVLRITSLATDMSLLLGSSLKKRGFAPVIMKRLERISPILLEDLSFCITDAIHNPKASNNIIEVAGKEEYTFLELQDLFSEAIGKKIRLIFVPLLIANIIAYIMDSITINKFNARGLVSAFTGGSTCDISIMNDIFRLEQGSFKEYLTEHFKDSDYPHG